MYKGSNKVVVVFVASYSSWRGYEIVHWSRRRFSKVPETSQARKAVMCKMFTNKYSVFVDFES